MTTEEFKALYTGKDGTRSVIDVLLIEKALEISINGQPFTVTMQTPGRERELALGLLFTEGVFDPGRIIPNTLIHNENQINVIIPEELMTLNGKRSMLSVSSCGICGKTDLESIDFVGQKVAQSRQVVLSDIDDWFKIMNAHQKDFLSSGGAHAAAIFSQNGNLLTIQEDIGRHNAVDKAIGTLLIDSRLDEVFAMTVSGRLSFEIVSKAAKANIQVLAAVSAPSSMAVELAEQLGMVLFGFCRDGKATCYSGSESIAH